MTFIVTPSFSKSSVSKMFSSHTNNEKLRFREGLVWTVGQTVEIKLRFQISPVWSGHCLRVDVRGTTLSEGTIRA